MVLTRLSHVGEVCPLRDHSYSDPIFSYNNQVSTSRRVLLTSKVNSENLPTEDEESSIALSAESSSLHILGLPAEILEKILSYLTFKNVGEIRKVCKKFDSVGAGLLNLGFHRLQKVMLHHFQATKSRMPRRESARRKHPLVRESDLLETLLMRLSLLQMTFGKHIQKKHCCFFPGEVLDEVHRILRCVKSNHNMGKVFKSTDELFDLTAMAMEYFKEHIEPDLPMIFKGTDKHDDIIFSEDESYTLRGGWSLAELDDDFLQRETVPHSNMVLRKRIRRMKQGMKRYNNQMSTIKKELKSCRSKIAHQNKQSFEYLTRLEQYEKRVDDTTTKFQQVFQELRKCRSELEVWRSRFRPCTEPQSLQCECGRNLEFYPMAEVVLKQSEDHFAPTGSLGSGSYPQTPLSLSPAPSVKNLESWFEAEEMTPVASSSEIIRSAPKDLIELTLPLLTPALEDKVGSLERFLKRSSSDDDTDDESDTVGKRVKSRKRAKV